MIRVTRPVLGDRELRAIGAVLESGFLTQGEHVARFEASVAAATGTPHVVAVSSGAAALHLAVMALGIGPGDEVITSDFSFPATANVIELVGARTVLVDVDLATLNLDVTQVEAAVTPRTRAILPVHEFGLMAEMEPIQGLARRHGLAVIEDAACALGAAQRIAGGLAMAGSAGTVGCFSFHPRKCVTTGEGGCLTTADATLAARVRALRNHGLESGPGGLDLTAPGLNYRLGEIQGALGVAQMERLDWVLAERRRLAALYDEGLAACEMLQRPQEPKDSRHAYQSYVVLLPEGLARDAVIARLRAEGIEAVRGAYAIHRLAYYRARYAPAAERFPAASAADARALALPLYAGMPDTSVGRVVETLRRVLA